MSDALPTRTVEGTLASSFSFSGTGLHSGLTTRVVVEAAKARTGIRFVRSDLPDAVEIPARVENVAGSTLATTLGLNGQHVSTVEHLLAALASESIDNARVLVDGPEVPILDGSALPFVRAIRAAGRHKLDVVRRQLVIRKEVSVNAGIRRALLRPASGFQIAIFLDFPHPYFDGSLFELALAPGVFAESVAWARTFCLEGEIDAMRRRGLALGGSLDNALVLDGDGVLNPGGLRGPHEAHRHKILDATGDLALLGLPVRGRLESWLPGHELHHLLLRTLLARPECWEAC
jgi:UDP-3-O-[3-hydroxymyristoyl] N-acetylglucosamine deacetylase